MSRLPREHAWTESGFACRKTICRGSITANGQQNDSAGKLREAEPDANRVRSQHRNPSVESGASGAIDQRKVDACARWTVRPAATAEPREHCSDVEPRAEQPSAWHDREVWRNAFHFADAFPASPACDDERAQHLPECVSIPFVLNPVLRTRHSQQRAASYGTNRTCTAHLFRTAEPRKLLGPFVRRERVRQLWRVSRIQRTFLRQIVLRRTVLWRIVWRRTQLFGAFVA